MTIGTIPFPDFDHLYASSGGSTRDSCINTAQSYLSYCHLNMIEEQARIIEIQNQEITNLRKQNESLFAGIQRMNQRFNFNQCNGKIRQTSNGDVTNVDDEENTERHISNTENSKSNFRIRFRRNELTLNDNFRKRNKMVRFVEVKRSIGCPAAIMLPKRNNAQTVDDKLKMQSEILFLNSGASERSTKIKLNEHDNQQAKSSATESDVMSVSKKGKKKVKLPILTTNEPYFMTAREDFCHLYDPVTYTPTALEVGMVSHCFQVNEPVFLNPTTRSQVPSFRVVEKNNINFADVPNDYHEDITTTSAIERHTRFEIAERKRKKWDVQRIRELRQTERLKEKLRRRKSRWNKLEQPIRANNETLEQITVLFPHIKSIEKIIITDCVPVTALGTSIPKIPTWGSEFHTKWLNDGTVDASQFESDHVTNPQPHLQQQRESRSRIT